MDSSVWIDFLSSSPSAAGAELRRMIADAEPFALTGIVVTEVLQGLRRDVSRIERYLAQWDLLEPVGYKTCRAAADIVRRARSKGAAVTTSDALIAAIALENGATLFTLDKDFTGIAAMMRLALYVF